ncbi:ABC transporter ATP-binding protein [Trichothermofontia sichuanensis B231]|uniref:ABC transporter ATP-binding protein n=1 Tax=Trichothermofontia sichuanensis TaxID=3045816 RepID=UPI0022455469|nr:ABC transporter ATP-binding protein [Trichothermofontia sichuanensis]UZQ54618.1 ABC transporter ATP-binding protein [Trichothermofontia sichuanensis B231]
MRHPVLELSQLTVKFSTGSESRPAVDRLSLTVHPGQTLGIVGESGSGKSVTALAIMGLLPATGQITQGEIWFRPPQQQTGAIDLRQLSPTQMQGYRGSQLAMIFQEPLSSLNPVYTIGQQLIEAIRLDPGISPAAARAQAIARLQEVKLLPDETTLSHQFQAEAQKAGQPRWDQPQLQREIQRYYQAFLDRYPHQLSGGQIQRVMLAMAIARQPALLIADEPTTALDVTVQATILDLLRELRDRHQMSLIFISHDLGVMAEIADTVAVLYQGRLVECSPVLEIFSNPQHPYTQGLLACRPPLDRRPRRLLTVADFMADVPPDNGHIQGTVHTASAQTLPQVAPHPQPLPPLETEAELNQRLATLHQQEPLLSVRDLHVTFPVQGIWGRTRRYIVAVNGVSFEIYPGETVGLVGESGCGKTTLARTLLRLNRPSHGEIWFAGENVAYLSGPRLQRLRRDLRIVFQNPFSSLNPRMTIGDILMEPLRLHSTLNRRQRQEEAIRLLADVGLLPQAGQTALSFLKRYPHEFSGGQRQRICIARALALQPRLIICDESVSALDVSVQAQVLNLLKALQQKHNLTYLFISHDLSVVKFMSDRILVMNRGRIEESGPAEQIYRQPQQPYTRALIAAIPTGSLDRIRARLSQST